jgi:type VI secretion system protein ImpH
MASTNGAPDDRVNGEPEAAVDPAVAEALAAELRKRELVQAAARRGFFGLVSLLERLQPQAARVGGSGPPAAEAVRFRHDPRLTFAASDVSQVREIPSGWEVMTTFLGVTGASGPVPVHIAEEVAHEDDEHPLRRDFLDLFHHRLVALLYRVVAKFDWPRDATTTADDDWSLRALTLTGFDPFAELPPRLPRWRLLRLASLLSTQARTAHGLRLALEDILGPELEGATFAIEEFIGQWVVLEDRHKTRLGRENSRLSADFVLGGRVWDRAGAFRVTIGPLTQAEYDRLLPRGDLHRLATDICTMVVAEPLDCELELVMADAPTFVLDPKRARLGHNTWLAGSGRDPVRRVVELTDFR